ncbi:MAG: hypothetical protein OXM02_14495 [Bacteroidota bacterium]|nr:hypothetical protein [Bacteroidota bacterium]MDE2956312.1 hypothetical protein [Bacteroidota bacterium]
MIQAKEAVRIAKEYLEDLYEEEDVKDIGLEELRFDGGKWRVTIGFRRVWPLPKAAPTIAEFLTRRTSDRTYKTVQISEDGRILALNHREVAYGESST